MHLHRLWSMRRPWAQAIGAIVLDRDYIADRAAVLRFDAAETEALALVTMVKLGPGRLERRAGVEVIVQPMSRSPLDRTTKLAAFRTEGEALEALEETRRMYLDLGWIEVSIDPVHDPD